MSSTASGVRTLNIRVGSLLPPLLAFEQTEQGSDRASLTRSRTPQARARGSMSGTVRRRPTLLANQHPPERTRAAAQTLHRLSACHLHPMSRVTTPRRQPSAICGGHALHSCNLSTDSGRRARAVRATWMMTFSKSLLCRPPGGALTETFSGLGSGQYNMRLKRTAVFGWYSLESRA